MKIMRLACITTAALALALFASSCGGGKYGTADSSGGGETPSATYAEFVDKAMVVHFETPVSVDASVSRAVDSSNVSIVENLTGEALQINRMVLSSDGLTLTIYGSFKYLTPYDVALTGLVSEGGNAIADLSLSAESGVNPRSLTNGRYGDLVIALGSIAAIFNGLDIVPASEDSNTIDLVGLLAESWTYTDPFTEDGCALGSSNLNIPAYMQIGDGHSFMVGRVGSADACGDIFAESSADVSMDKAQMEVSRTTFLYFEDRDAGPVAEFMPAGNTIVTAFPMMSGPFDFNGDGIADFGFVETSTADLGVAAESKAVGLSFAGYEYLRIFFGRGDGGFTGRIDLSEADVTIPVQGFTETLSVYNTWVADLNLSATPPYYPAFGHGDLNGDGFDDIALAIYDTSLGRMVVKIWMGAAEGGVREEADSVVSAPGNQTYPEMIPNVIIADVNGDGKGDLVLGSTFEIAPYAGAGDLMKASEIDPGMIQILLGRDPWPAGLSTGSADARIIEENSGDELGRVTMLGLISNDYNNDGYADLLIAAPRAVYDENNRIYRGKVFLFLGGSDIGTDAAWEEMPAGDADMIFVADASQDIMSGTVLYDPGDMLNDGNFDVFLAAGRSKGAALYFYNVGDDSAGVFGADDAKSIIELSLR